jgi:hypothetical protein
MDYYINGGSLRLQTAPTTRLSSGWSWRMAQVVPPQYLLEHFGNLARLRKFLFNIISKFIRLFNSLSKAEISSNNLKKLSLKNNLSWKTTLPASY